MNITESIIKKIYQNGIVIADYKDVYLSIDCAIIEGRFHYIKHNGKNIGFCTFEKQGDSIFINNMLIEKLYRGKINLRRYFISTFGNGAFHWKNRKHQRDIKRRIPCSCSV